MLFQNVNAEQYLRKHVNLDIIIHLTYITA